MPPPRSLRRRRQSLKTNRPTIFQFIKEGKVRLVVNQINAGANVNERDDECRTPLMHSVSCNSGHAAVHLVKFLLDNGADVNAQDLAGKTALIHACYEEGRGDLMREITNCPTCDPNLVDNDGNTALHHGVVTGSLETVGLLVSCSFEEHPLEVDVVNNAEMTPLVLAVKQLKREIAHVLVFEGGANRTLVADQAMLKRLLGEESKEKYTPSLHRACQRLSLFLKMLPKGQLQDESSFVETPRKDSTVCDPGEQSIKPVTPPMSERQSNYRRSSIATQDIMENLFDVASKSGTKGRTSFIFSSYNVESEESIADLSNGQKRERRKISFCIPLEEETDEDEDADVKDMDSEHNHCIPDRETQLSNGKISGRDAIISRDQSGLERCVENLSLYHYDKHSRHSAKDLALKAIRCQLFKPEAAVLLRKHPVTGLFIPASPRAGRHTKVSSRQPRRARTVTEFRLPMIDSPSRTSRNVVREGLRTA